MDIAPSGSDAGSSNHGAVEYEALSYSWGDPSPAFTIQCDGKPLPVARNLFFALQQLRLENETRKLWIDAICINQQDLRERSEQVLRMLQIYQNAVHVIVWLGQEAEDSHLAFESMKRLDERAWRVGVMFRSHETGCYDLLHRMYDAQRRVFERPWFRRSWIRQEISVAKNVTFLCGRDAIGWYPLKRASARLRRYHLKMAGDGVPDLVEYSEDRATAIKCLTRGWIYGKSVVKLLGCIGSIWYHHTGGFLDLLMAGREYEATDPRDKVYSVLGLGRVNPPSGPLPSPVDYSKSVSEVYQDVVKYFVNRDRNLDILAILRYPQKRGLERGSALLGP